MKTCPFEVNIYHLIEGAKQADGLAVIIDVFRAFSLECYLYDMGAAAIRPVGSVEEAFRLRNSIENSILVGERGGEKCDGFEFGNSPSSIKPQDVAGKTVIHTTSAGTQGIVNAVHADKILTGSLVNAKAIAAYIKKMQPQKVSLVCMGNGGVTPAAEDELCAEYIKYLLEGGPDFDIESKVQGLKTHGGEQFFRKSSQHIFPEEDFYMCTKYDRFSFVIEVEKDEDGFFTRKIPV
ncbi:MAG: 2-phosphosulfolactate phosphatase [Clostridiales bacterium]|nr:2-phosphosulfolactate phosphatase [Candidatus Blautia equi]